MIGQLPWRINRKGLVIEVQCRESTSKGWVHPKWSGGVWILEALNVETQLFPLNGQGWVVGLHQMICIS